MIQIIFLLLFLSPFFSSPHYLSSSSIFFFFFSNEFLQGLPLLLLLMYHDFFTYAHHSFIVARFCVGTMLGWYIFFQKGGGKPYSTPEINTSTGRKIHVLQKPCCLMPSRQTCGALYQHRRYMRIFCWVPRPSLLVPRYYAALYKGIVYSHQYDILFLLGPEPVWHYIKTT